MIFLNIKNEEDPNKLLDIFKTNIVSYSSVKKELENLKIP